MRRRNFLGSMLAIPMATKVIVSNAKEVKVYEKEKEISHVSVEDEESEMLTNDFFEYLKNHKTKFNWKQMKYCTEHIQGDLFTAKTRKLKPYISERYSKFNKDMKQYTLKCIVEEMEAEFRELDLNMFHFYILRLTPAIYDPETFEPRYCMMIRYVRR